MTKISMEATQNFIFKVLLRPIANSKKQPENLHFPHKNDVTLQQLKPIQEE